MKKLVQNYTDCPYIHWKWVWLLKKVIRSHIAVGTDYFGAIGSIIRLFVYHGYSKISQFELEELINKDIFRFDTKLYDDSTLDEQHQSYTILVMI